MSKQIDDPDSYLRSSQKKSESRREAVITGIAIGVLCILSKIVFSKEKDTKDIDYYKDFKRKSEDRRDIAIISIATGILYVFFSGTVDLLCKDSKIENLASVNCLFYLLIITISLSFISMCTSVQSADDLIDHYNTTGKAVQEYSLSMKITKWLNRLCTLTFIASLILFTALSLSTIKEMSNSNKSKGDSGTSNSSGPHKSSKGAIPVVKPPKKASPKPSKK